jgi:hypothetical protein
MVLYFCETWSLTLRQEHRLRVSENRVVRRMFGPKRDEVTGGWWEDNINMDLKELKWGGMDWIDLAQDRD